MTENIIELRQWRDAENDSIRISSFDLEQALSEYLLQNGQITNADEVVGLEILSEEQVDGKKLVEEAQIIVKREPENGISK